jgi:hypothetical protein
MLKFSFEVSDNTRHQSTVAANRINIIIPNEFQETQFIILDILNCHYFYVAYPVMFIDMYNFWLKNTRLWIMPTLKTFNLFSKNFWTVCIIHLFLKSSYKIKTIFQRVSGVATFPVGGGLHWNMLECSLIL